MPDLPSIMFLLVNHLFVHNLSRTRLNIIHPAYPFQYVICQITVQSAAHQQIQIYSSAVFFQMTTKALSHEFYTHS